MDEAALEDLTMAWFSDIGYQTAFGPDILDERGDVTEVILWKRFEAALGRINPSVPGPLLNQAIRQFKRSLTCVVQIKKDNMEACTTGLITF